MNSEQLISSGRELISILENNGYEAYFVGGCVRDTKMSRHLHDIDIATSALPEQTCETFTDLGYRVVKTGMKHGTVTVMAGGAGFEITTFRIDGEYTDNRHPDKVIFTENIENDLSRRDFTVNAMAMDKNGNIFDPFNGLDDIKNGVIKCVGEPDKRFSEDSLRIFRALRFASELDFKIDAHTNKAMSKLLELTKNVAVERKYYELSRILLGKGSGNVIYGYCNILSSVIYGIDNLPQRISRAEFIKYYNDIPGERSLKLAGIARVIYDGKITEQIRKVLNDLKSDKETESKVCLLCNNHNLELDMTEKELALKICDIGREAFEYLLTFISAYKDTAKISEKIIKLKSNGRCFSLAELDINGDDLLSVGYKGKDIKTELQNLLMLAATGEIENKKEALIKKALEDKADN